MLHVSSRLFPSLPVSSRLLFLVDIPKSSNSFTPRFELAAYRKANPTGKIVLAPLYIEAIVSSTMLGSYAVLFVFWLTQAMSVRLSFTYAAGYILSLIPAYIAFHFQRLCTRQKTQLVAELKSFDVELAECRSPYDR